MFTTSSFNINIIRAAVDQYVAKHGSFGNPVAIPSHISSDTFEAMGYAESTLDGVAIEIGRIATRMTRERDARFERNMRLREQFANGEISEEQFMVELSFA